MGWPKSEWPEFRLLVDPVNFLIPQVFDPHDERWAEQGRASAVDALCRNGKN
jgi:hypothetical protein